MGVRSENTHVGGTFLQGADALFRLPDSGCPGRHRHRHRLAGGFIPLSLSMLIETPKGGYYLGKEGGIANAIVGSLYLSLGATILSFLLALPIAFALQKEYSGPRFRGSPGSPWTFSGEPPRSSMAPSDLSSWSFSGSAHPCSAVSSPSPS